MNLAATRAAAQLLHRPAEAGGPAEIARAIAGVQAQDAYAGRLAFRARNATLTAADIDRARTEERSIVRTWAMRKTVHLIAAEDWHWMVPLFEPVMVRESTRRLAHFGFDPPAQERALAEIERLLGEGPLDRSALSAAVERATGIEVTIQIRTHLYRLAVASGLATMGPDLGGRTCLVLERDWLGERPDHDRDAALRELARRYLRAFGPASEADFAGWSGLGLRDLRRGLTALGSQIEEVPSLAGPLLRLSRGADRAVEAEGVVRLLPAFDTFLMGHRDRDFIAAPEEWPRIGPGGGILNPVILRGGAAIGVWKPERRPNRIAIRLEVFPSAEPLDAETRAAIEDEVADIARFEGIELQPPPPR